MGRFLSLGLLLLSSLDRLAAFDIRSAQRNETTPGRERLSINNNWRFKRTEQNPDGLTYDKLKTYILPSANDFIKDKSSQHMLPAGHLDSNVSFAQQQFDDATWENITLPHDWAIKGPFYVGNNVPVGGGMGRLPTQGVGWYRRTLSFSSSDKGKNIYLDIDGAQSYAMVWLNEEFVGGWPYGYASFRLDLTPYLKLDGENLLAVRLENPTDSSRWYPGGGIYRNVWITKVDPVHVSEDGTLIITENVSKASATVRMVIQVENDGDTTQSVDVATDIHILDPETGDPGAKVAEFPRFSQNITGGSWRAVTQTTKVNNPLLWSPRKPNMYVAISRLSRHGKIIDTYETPFGIRSFTYDSNKGLLVNDEHVRIQGVNQHHDLGALGAAFNLRAATRQLEILKELGCNAIRMSHNPPAPELLDLADRMGFLVMDEIFDSWKQNKTANDFHLIFNDWHEPDLRKFIRRDRNHPSIFAWSVGNEVGEQYTDTAGAAVAKMLVDIVHEEDPTRPVTASMNYAKPNMPFPAAFDILSLNYQGEGIRDAPAYAQLSGIKTSPLYPEFHSKFPQKMLLSSETAAALSTRGTYIFPVVDGNSAPVNDTSGGNSTSLHVSAYELYSADFGASPDKVFTAQDNNSYVAGEFVWSGFDYLGEPTPYYTARSSYFGIVDLAGFPKDRYFLYQSRWRPDLKMAHILPHWTWPDRVGKATPVHVFSSGDEAELFLNGKSLGKQKRGTFEYRFRWDNVTYTPGTLTVQTYKSGTPWANATVQTAGSAAELRLTADRSSISADGKDLSYIKVEVLDDKKNVVPQASNLITFEVSDGGELAATDNGNPADFTSFGEKKRNAFSGLALGIVKAKTGGSFTVTASAEGLQSSSVKIQAL